MRRTVKARDTPVEGVVCDEVRVYAREETDGFCEGWLEEASMGRMFGSVGR